MFGHDNHDDNDDKTQGAPLPPDPVPSPLGNDTNDVPAHIGPNPTPPETISPHPDDAAAAPAASDAPVDSDLLDIKQKALQQLTPLVGHLDQTPEEKFRTTMMMIQGADNQALIKDAYAAAQEITDEKARAQALLDIVNEINYFTQHANA